MKRVLGIAIAGLTLAAPAAAQEPEDVFVTTQPVVGAKIAAQRLTVESRITRGAPYSGEAVTESVQVLSDGNRIVTRQATRVFRDSDGRTRREQLTSNGVDVHSINISDPVAQTSYFLDPQARTAYQNGLLIAASAGAVSPVDPVGHGTIEVASTGGGSLTVSSESRAAGEVRMKAPSVTSARSSGGFAAIRVGPPGPELAWKIAAEGESSQESLGEQTIEGVKAAGTRTTTVIPAGAIGNEQAIRIVSEQWYSAELQLLVMTRHSDPRVGETTYRLTNVVRAEPARSLFEVPPDYSLKESFIRKYER